MRKVKSRKPPKKHASGILKAASAQFLSPRNHGRLGPRPAEWRAAGLTHGGFLPPFRLQGTNFVSESLPVRQHSRSPPGSKSPKSRGSLPIKRCRCSSANTYPAANRDRPRDRLCPLPHSGSELARRPDAKTT